jgi:phosphopantetheinyl transferase (holo-ACP synthase)
VEVRTDERGRPALRGKATLGSTFPPPPPPREVQAADPCPHRAEELYSIPLLFHGPRFYVVSKLHGMSDSGMIADLTLRDPEELFADPPSGPLVFDPVMLDGVGQVVGYKLFLDDWVVYPLKLGRLTRYGPTPPPGSVVHVRARYRRIDGRRVEMDADVFDAAGKLWLRADGWQVWRILWPRELSTFSRQPREHRVGIPWTTKDPRAVCCRMMSKLFGEISPDWIARYCLTPREWEVYRQRPRFDWLLGRITLKDAVRDWFRRNRGQVLLHLEVEIANLPSGQPVVVAPAGEKLAVSLSHIEDEAIAIVAEAEGAGIDLAAVTERAPEFRSQAFDPDELAVIDRQEGDALAWLHRGWCAKEALAKAHGLGLEALGRFRIRGADADGTIEVEVLPDRKRHRVDTYLDAGRAFAAVTLG